MAEAAVAEEALGGAAGGGGVGGGSSGVMNGVGSSVVNGIFSLGNTALQAKYNKQMQQAQYTQQNALIANAQKSLKAAGLPAYTLYTGGYMPNTKVFRPGTSGFVNMPMGASSMWYTRSTT